MPVVFTSLLKHLLSKSARLGLLLSVGLLVHSPAIAQSEGDVAIPPARSLFADVNYLGINFLDSYYQLVTFNMGVDRLRPVKNVKMGFSYGLTVSRLLNSSETFLGTNCTFTVVTDFHLLAKIGFSFNPLHISPRQNNADSNLLLLFPILSIGYRYPLLDEKAYVFAGLGTTGIGIGVGFNPENFKR